MKKVVVLTLMVFLNSSLDCKEFPFGPKGRFTNREYVSGGYVIKHISIPARENLDYVVNSSGKLHLPAQHPGIQFSTQLTYKDNMRSFENNRHRGLIVRKFGNKKDNVYTEDKIIFYLYNKSSNSGSKVIFDVDKFENFMHQTWEFNNLSTQKLCSRPDLGDIMLDFDLTYGLNNSLKFTRAPLIISYESREAYCDYKTYPITSWRSHSKVDHVTYDDLYKENIIVVENSLTDDEIKEILKK